MEKEILFGKRISKLRRDVSELETEMQVIAGLATYSPAMDQYDLKATVRDLKGAAKAAENILSKLKQLNRS